MRTSSSAGDPVRVLSAVAVQAALKELTAMFEAEIGGKVALAFDTNPAVARRIENGAAFDVAILNPHLIDDLTRLRLVDVTTRLKFGTSPIGVGVRAGGRAVDVSSEAAFVRLLLEVKSIGYSSEGTSGKRFLEAVDRLHILEAVRTKLIPLAGGALGTAVAAGEVEISIAPISTILAAAPATEVAGVLPRGLASQIDLELVIATSLLDRDRAQAFIDFLTRPSIDAFVAAKGIERIAALPLV